MLRPRMIANGIRRVVQKADSKVWCLWEMTRQGSLDSKAGMAMTMVEQMGWAVQQVETVFLLSRRDAEGVKLLDCYKGKCATAGTSVAGA